MSEALSRLVVAFAEDADVTPPEPNGRRFGSRGLKVCGRVFAMEVSGALVLKLPSARIDALVESGEGSRYEYGGRTLKEWVVVSPGMDGVGLAREARAFVAG